MKRVQEMVRQSRENYSRRCSIENMEDGSGWTTKDRKPETEVE